MSKSIINGKLMDEDSMSGTALKIQRAGARMVEQVTSTTSPFYEQDEELSEQQKQSLVRSEKNESAVVVKLASVFSNVSSPSIEDKSINKYTTKNTFRINIDE